MPAFTCQTRATAHRMGVAWIAVEDAMTKYLLAHDLGTSADKASLFTTDGEFIATKTVGYPSYHLANGGVEQDPEDWWNAFCTSTKTLISETGVDPADILAVGFDGTYANAICLDENGESVCRAMIWQDTRSAAEVDELDEMIPMEIRNNYRSPHFMADETLPKFYWLYKHKPELAAKTKLILIAGQDYIIYRLCGVAATETAPAAKSRFMNREWTDWNDEILKYVGLTRDNLPSIHKNTDIVGEVPEGMLEVCGLAAGTKLGMGTGDTRASMIGAGLVSTGDAFLNGGTSAGVYGFVEGEDGSSIRVGGLTSASGGSYSWLVKEICRQEQAEADAQGVSVYDIVNAKVASAPVGSNGLFYHPYLAGERYPWNNNKAQGSFVGLSLTTTREEMLRAVIEGIGFNISYILDQVRDAGLTDIKSLPIVGGLGKSEVVRQILADTLDIEIEVPKAMQEAATIGGAILVGIGLGIYEDEKSAVQKYLEIVDVTKPIPENVEKYKKLKPTFKAIYDALCPVYPDIYELRRWLAGVE